MNKWIQHVTDYSKKNNIKFRDALKDENCKKEYQPSDKKESDNEKHKMKKVNKNNHLD